MNRTYECRNTGCPDYANPVTVKGLQLDTLWEFPNVVCGCGCEPMIVGPQVINAQGALGGQPRTELTA